MNEPWGLRTPDLPVKSRMLYQAKLRAPYPRSKKNCFLKFFIFNSNRKFDIKTQQKEKLYYLAYLNIFVLIQ